MEKLENVIYDLKKEYDDIFYIEIEGEDFIFRPLTRFEYEELLVKRDLREDVLSEVICDIAVLYPEKYDFNNPHVAGAPEALCNQIVYYSGFDDPDYIDELLYDKQEELDNNVFTMMENVITVAFPTIDIEDVKKMDAYEIIDYYARAAWIINNMYANIKMPQQIPGEESEQPAQQAQPQQAQQAGMQGGQQNQLHQMAMNKQTMGDNMGTPFQ